LLLGEPAVFTAQNVDNYKFSTAKVGDDARFLQRFGEREALLALGCIISGLVFSFSRPISRRPTIC
jgi:hypothetical protein